MAKSPRQRRPPPPRRPVNGRATTTGNFDDGSSSLVARIGVGQLDADLPGLIQAINARLAAIRTMEARQALGRLAVGDRVRLTDTVSPQYLRGLPGEVHDIDEGHVVVCLDEPVGRFSSGHVNCSPLALEPIGPSHT